MTTTIVLDRDPIIDKNMPVSLDTVGAIPYCTSEGLNTRAAPSPNAAAAMPPKKPSKLSLAKTYQVYS